MGQTAEGSRSFCVTKPSLVCALVLVPFLVLSCFLGVWFLPFLVTVSILALSTLLFVTFKKTKVVFDVNPEPTVQAEDLICSSKHQLGDEEDADSEKVQSETESVAQVEGNQIHHDFKSSEIEMESESDDGDELIKSPDFETTDDSVSASSDDEDNDEEDDDSLIEIALPCENSKQKVQSNLAADLLSESIFGQEGLMELLAEINEEDNLIEIDISKFGHYELNLKS